MRPKDIRARNAQARRLAALPLWHPRQVLPVLVGVPLVAACLLTPLGTVLAHVVMYAFFWGWALLALGAGVRWAWRRVTTA
jgi:hypothetical protein